MTRVVFCIASALLFNFLHYKGVEPTYLWLLAALTGLFISKT